MPGISLSLAKPSKKPLDRKIEDKGCYIISLPEELWVMIFDHCLLQTKIVLRSTCLKVSFIFSPSRPTPNQLWQSTIHEHFNPPHFLLNEPYHRVFQKRWVALRNFPNEAKDLDPHEMIRLESWDTALNLLQGCRPLNNRWIFSTITPYVESTTYYDPETRTDTIDRVYMALQYTHPPGDPTPIPVNQIQGAAYCHRVILTRSDLKLLAWTATPVQCWSDCVIGDWIGGSEQSRSKSGLLTLRLSPASMVRSNPSRHSESRIFTAHCWRASTQGPSLQPSEIRVGVDLQTRILYWSGSLRLDRLEVRIGGLQPIVQKVMVTGRYEAFLGAVNLISRGAFVFWPKEQLAPLTDSSHLQHVVSAQPN